jgi:hypothetical protein
MNLAVSKGLGSSDGPSGTCSCLGKNKENWTPSHCSCFKYLQGQRQRKDNEQGKRSSVPMAGVSATMKQLYQPMLSTYWHRPTTAMRAMTIEPASSFEQLN